VTARGTRVLGFWSLLTLGINGIVGVGIFFAPSELFGLVPGAASSLAFVLTGLLLLPVAWIYGRLGSAFAEDGGPYVWAREALGERFAFGVGVIAYASALLSTSAVVSGLGQYLAPELGFESSLERFSFRVAAAATFCGVALLGLRWSAWVWSALTMAKLVPLVLLAGLGSMQLVRSGVALDWHATPAGLARAALIAVFPLQGFEIVPVPAAEVKGGRRTVLGTTLLSLAIGAGLYVLLQLACVHALPNLATERAPIVAAGSHYSHGKLTGLFAAGTNVSAIGIAFAMFAMTPRYLSALGTEALFGKALARESRGVPTSALLLTSAGVCVLVSSSSLSGLFVLSSLAVLLQYAVSAVALFRLAARRERGLGVLDQWLAPLSLLAIASLVRAAQLVEVLVLLGILGAGFGALWLRRSLASRCRAR
jgi:amino acid transporter